MSIFALGVVFGIFMFDHDTLSFRALFVVLASLSVLFVAVSSFKNGSDAFKRMIAVALAVAAFSFGVLRISLYNNSAESSKLLEDEKDTVELEVAEISKNYIDGRVISSEIDVKEGKNLRFYPENISEDILIGDRITADVGYSCREDVKYYSKGITLSASGTISEIKKGNGLFYRVRKSVADNNELLFSDFNSALPISKAVVVGDRSGIDSHLYSLYKNSGLSHLLAISGLHISLIAMSLYNLLIMLSVNRKVCCVAASLTALFYAALVGFTAGAVRSAIMLLILLMSRLFLRRADSITSLFVALFVLIVINPYSIASASLQLSFLCSLGIILFEPILHNFKIKYDLDKRKFTGFKRAYYTLFPAIVSSLGISFVSSVFSFPVLCFGFDTVSYIAPLTNLFAVPLFSYGVRLSLISYIVAPFSAAVGKIIAYPAGMLFDLVTDFSRWVYDLDVGSMSVHIPMMKITLLISVSMIGALVFVTRGRKKFFFITALAFCVSLAVCGLVNEFSTSQKTVVEYGDSDVKYVYVQSQEMNTYIDLSGFTSNPDAVFKNGNTALERYVMVDLNSYSLKRFDYLSGNMNIKELHLPKPQNKYESKVFSQIKTLANDRNCDIITFDEYYSHIISGSQQIQIFGNGNDVSEQMLVCVNVGDKKIRFLGKGFDNAVKCDVAVALSGYEGESDLISSKEFYVNESFFNDDSDLTRRANDFKECLRIEFKKRESDYVIYEP